MTSSHHITPEDVGPFLQESGKWPLALFCLHQHLAPYFACPEPSHHALLYLQAVMSEIPRKNSWQIAEHAKQPRPYGMQRLLSQAIWDDEGVRNETRAVREQKIGTHHPKTTETRTCLIALLHTLGQHEESAQLEAVQTELRTNEEELKTHSEQ